MCQEVQVDLKLMIISKEQMLGRPVFIKLISKVKFLEEKTF